MIILGISADSFWWVWSIQCVSASNVKLTCIILLLGYYPFCSKALELSRMLGMIETEVVCVACKLPWHPLILLRSQGCSSQSARRYVAVDSQSSRSPKRQLDFLSWVLKMVYFSSCSSKCPQEARREVAFIQAIGRDFDSMGRGLHPMIITSLKRGKKEIECVCSPSNECVVNKMQ